MFKIVYYAISENIHYYDRDLTEIISSHLSYY